MTDPNVTTINIESASIILNAVLLIVLGVVIIYAKQIDEMARNISAWLGNKSKIFSRRSLIRRCDLLVPLRLIFVGIIVTMIGLSSLPNSAIAQSPAKPHKTAQSRMSVIVPQIDAQRGRRLFVTKGCFICHSVKGVGGKAAPNLDATSKSRAIDVLGFVARMWKGAPLMYELQSMELGYRIELERDEIADLAGFVGDARAQEGFSKEEIPEVVQEWMVNQAWWKDRSINLGDMLPGKFPDLEGTDPSKP